VKGTKIVLAGGAGLVGQNLVVRLQAQGFTQLVVLDKHASNLAVLRRLHPNITAELADLAEPGSWERHFEGAGAVVMLQAQIGAGVNDSTSFQRNNVDASARVLAAMQTHGVDYLVHVSSSVVESVANDDYTKTKRLQEELIAQSSIPHIVLRPTLMFGWFDRKHLGWLSRFMRRVPVFPIPGHGRYMRQPLYVGDFCNIIIRCIETRASGEVLNISGIERIDYIDMIRAIRRAIRAHTVIVTIPLHWFDTLLRIWCRFDPNPPFTSDQLRALTGGDEFELIDWQSRFGVRATRFENALVETFQHPTYSRVVLEF
jgi:nucleoside-diphosphate-sugar epimerase